MQREEDHEAAKGTPDAEDNQPLTQLEIDLKDDLVRTGFTDWSKNDFYNFVSGSEKYGRSSFG